MRFSLCVFGAALLGIHPTLAQEAVVRVSMSGSGSVRIDGTEMMTFAPGMFLEGWQHRSFSMPANATPMESEARLDGGRVACAAAIEGRDQGFRLTYGMTPDVSLRVSSINMSFSLPARLWIGSAWEAPGAAGEVPIVHEGTHLNAAPGSLSLTRPGQPPVVFRCPTGQSILLQDSREWGDNLEVRVGPQTGEGAEWVAGDTVTITVEVDLGMATEIEQDQPVTLEPSDEWVPFENRLDIVPGSALDWTGMGLADGPAGKHGPVVVGETGHFEFEGRPGEPVRFYGINLCFNANYPSHEESDRLAARLRALGYNSVRIHHYETDLVGWDAPDSLTFREEQLDRFDYLMAACKREGLYVTTDLYVSRPVRRAEIFGEGEGTIPQDDFKMLVLVHEGAYANFAEFSRRLLTHVNPYTGLSLGADPVLATLVVVNEGNGGNFVGSIDGEVQAAWQRVWNEWLLDEYGGREGLAAAWADSLGADEDPTVGTVGVTGGGHRREADRQRFTCQRHLALYRRVRDLLRDELGVRALLTDQNGWTEPLGNQVLRGEYDFVDSHMYWDHPNFLANPWQLPSRGWSAGRSAVYDGGAGARDRALLRVTGKPFTISEFNYVVPNAHRHEGGLLMGSVAAIQDWDGLYRFSYSHQRDRSFEPMGMTFFDLASDPICQASDRLAVALFLRGDLAPAEPLVTLRVPEDLLDPGLASMPRAEGGLESLAYTTRLASTVGAEDDADIAFGALDSSMNEGVPPTVERQSTEAVSAVLDALRSSQLLPGADRLDPAAGVWQSPGGEVLIDGGQGVATVGAARTSAVFRATEGPAAAGALDTQFNDAGGMVWATSVDGEPLSVSARIVVSHLTEILNAGMRFGDLDRTTLLEWGGLPLLVKRSTATVSLALYEPGAYTVYALATDGARLGQVPASIDAERLTFTADPAAFEGGCIYYEVAR
jgi:hypothetical protein